MALTCQTCAFKTDFETTLTMHQQLHHNLTDGVIMDKEILDSTDDFKPNWCHREKGLESRSSTLPAGKQLKNKGSESWLNLANSTSKFLERLKLKMSKSRPGLTACREDKFSAIGQCCQACKPDVPDADSIPAADCLTDNKCSCHLCGFSADRITVLDRHLLNDHKIGLENLLKLVMAKTQRGLEDSGEGGGARRPYYACDGSEEYLLERKRAEVKLLKNCSTNTDLKWHEIPDAKEDSQGMRLDYPMLQSADNSELFSTMSSLSECFSKMADSSKVLAETVSRCPDARSLSDVARREDRFKGEALVPTDGDYFNTNCKNLTPDTNSSDGSPVYTKHPAKPKIKFRNRSKHGRNM